MLTFTNIYIEGFSSIGSLHLQLNTNTTVVMRGPNGHGKSTVFNAIVWALYGKTIKGNTEVTTWETYRTKGYQGAKVELYFQNGPIMYKVIRCQKYNGILEDGATGKDRLILLKDNELINVKGKNNIQNEINKSVGLSYTLFMNSVMFGQGIKRLIQESNPDKKKLFEEVFNLEFLNLAKGIAQQDKSVILSEINSLESESATLKKELQANKEAYFDLRNREKSFKADIKKERSDLEEEEKKLLGLLIKKQADISEDAGRILDHKLKTQNNVVNDLRNRIKINKETLATPLEDLVDEVINFINNKKYQAALKLLKPIKKAFSETQELYENYDQAIDRLREVEESHKKYTAKMKECDDIASDISDIREEIMNLKKRKLEILSPKYRKNLRRIRKDLRRVDEDFHNKELELENYDWLISDPLGNNGIKAYLFDSSLHILNHTLESYSKVLGFKVEFSMDLGSSRKDFVTLIERDGHIIDYEELSGGEKQMVDLAMAFAMHESLTATKGINIAFLDEVFESLSSDNIELVISLIKYIFENKTLFLVTHQESLALSNTKIMQVEKIKGLSYYKTL